MDLLIDVSRLAGRLLKGRLPTGVDRVCRAYLAHYGPEARALVRLGGRRLVFDQGASRRIFDSLQGAAGARSRLQIAGLMARGIGAVGLSRLAAGSVLLNPGHSGLESDGYCEWIRSRGIAALFLVHDLIPLTHPEFCRPGEDRRHLARMRHALEFVRGIVTNSQATLDALSDFARGCDTQLPPCTVALLGPGSEANTACRRLISEPYFVILGTIEPRKNHWLLLQVWRRLAERYGSGAPRLVLIGQRGWECENVVDMLERCEALRGIVIELPACPDAEVASYLKHAQALLLPSFAEGYGLPVLEALAQGAPVIASSLPVFREFARDIPEYIDPLDGRGWMEAIMDYAAERSARRDAQLARMAGFQPPTWAGHFDQVDRLLESIRV